MTCVSKESGDSNSDSVALQWYAIHVKSNFEQAVYRQLDNKGFHLFLPTYRAERRWSDRIKRLDVPLFPGYVFCRLDQQSWLPILTTHGVIRLVSNGKMPVPISDEEISSVRTLVNSNVPCMPWPSIAPGSLVAVSQGPLMGVQGVLVESRTGNRLVVSIDILNRAVAVEIDATWVHVSSPPPQAVPLTAKLRVV